MHPTEAALLKAIIADPADDMPRLMLADHLEEHGQSKRAEFIRCGLEMARRVDCVVRLATVAHLISVVDRPAYCGRCLYCRACRRFGKLAPSMGFGKALGPHAYVSDPSVADPTWRNRFTEVGRSVPALVYSRGFVSHLACPAEVFLQHADAYTTQQPLEEVILTTWPDLHSRYHPSSRETSYWLKRREQVRSIRPSDPPWEPDYPARRMLTHALLNAEWDRIKFTLPPEEPRSSGTVRYNGVELGYTTEWTVDNLPNRHRPGLSYEIRPSLTVGLPDDGSSRSN